MSSLPKYPCCGEDGLRIVNYTLENGQWHYQVTCDCCGIEFHHAKFYDYNEVAHYFDAVGRGICEDEASDDEFQCSRYGYGHDWSNDEMNDPKAFSYCPKCGSEVQR